MNEKEYQKLLDIGNHLKRINSKIKLLSLLNKAKREYEQNQLNDCKISCEEILKNEPENPAALRGLGCVAQAKDQFEKALEYYKKALIYSDKKEIEYTLIGTIYYLEDNLEEAIKYYNFAIDSNDDYEKAYEGRNQSLLEHHLKIADLQDNLIKRNLF